MYSRDILLVEYGWESTLLIFAAFIYCRFILAFYLTTPKDVVGGIIDDNQTACEALKEAFKSKSFIYLTSRFFCLWLAYNFSCNSYSNLYK